MSLASLSEGLNLKVLQVVTQSNISQMNISTETQSSVKWNILVLSKNLAQSLASFDFS